MELAYRIKRAAKKLSTGISAVTQKRGSCPTNFEEQIYRAAIQEGDICFDVGANVGEVAIFLARIATPRGCVVAFEPVFSVYSVLCQRVQADFISEGYDHRPSGRPLRHRWSSHDIDAQW